MNFLETWSELEKLHEWKYSDSERNKKITYDDDEDSTTEAPKKYLISYREEDEGFKKSFTITAKNAREAEQIAWGMVSVDDIWVTELDEALEQDSVEEALRVVSDPDVLYHATEAVPLYKIFSEDCLKGSVNAKAAINAVCLTTDSKYTIYKYPCKIQLSRQRLIDDGYELIPYDEFEDDTAGRGESEERILGDINNISKYVTHIYIDWTKISVAQSSQGDYISGPIYDKAGSEGEEWPLKLRDFRLLLRNLKAKGIRILSKGAPMQGEYYLDDAGKLNYGEMPVANIG